MHALLPDADVMLAVHWNGLDWAGRSRLVRLSVGGCGLPCWCNDAHVSGQRCMLQGGSCTGSWEEMLPEHCAHVSFLRLRSLHGTAVHFTQRSVYR